MKRIVVSVQFYPWWHPAYGGADTAIIPIRFIVSPDKALYLGGGHLGGITSAIEKFFLHPGPHALTAGIVMAPAAIAVHALDKAVPLHSCTVIIAGILAPTV